MRNSICIRLAMSLVVLVWSAFTTARIVAAEDADPRVFDEGTHGPASLAYRDDLPIAIFAGTPEEIGEQHAALLARQTKPIGQFTRDIAQKHSLTAIWPLVTQASDMLLARGPERFRRELDVACRNPDFDADAARVFNTGLELRRLGCSAVVVEPERSATGQVIFGRNFDFPPMDVLDRLGLVMVYRPKGYRAFVSVGFPGMVGVFSGMNDAGVAVATLDVYGSADGSPVFNGGGEPLAFVFRRILEECETIDDAERLLRGIKATTWTNLAVCDRRHAAIFEITPKQVIRRDAKDHLLPCTNHFRSAELAVDPKCWRYERLTGLSQKERIDLEEVHAALHTANQGEWTIQTMIFEPATLTMHVAMGKGPISNQPLKQVELVPLFEGGILKSPSVK